MRTARPRTEKQSTPSTLPTALTSVPLSALTPNLSPTKRCTKCGETKSLDLFKIEKRREQKRISSWCKACHNVIVCRWMKRHRAQRTAYEREWRHRNPEKAYQKTQEWKRKNPDKVRAMHKRWKEKKGSDYFRDLGLRQRYGVSLSQAKAMLAIQGGRCAICQTEQPERGRWYLDHCHKTGRIRGILCRVCNTGLGAFRDDPIILSSAMTYLAREDDVASA